MEALCFIIALMILIDYIVKERALVCRMAAVVICVIILTFFCTRAYYMDIILSKDATIQNKDTALDIMEMKVMISPDVMAVKKSYEDKVKQAQGIAAICDEAAKEIDFDAYHRLIMPDLIEYDPYIMNMAADEIERMECPGLTELAKDYSVVRDQIRTALEPAQ